MSKPTVYQKNKNLPWDIVERAVNKEIDWLKRVILTRKSTGALSFMEGGATTCDNCNYTYRKIALLIITGKIKAREITAKKNKDLWDGLSKKEIRKAKQRHGGEWHRFMMDVIIQFFEIQKYDITIEPHLNFGRADLGIYNKGKKNLYIEVGTVSIYKLWLNLQTIEEAIFLIVSSENKVVEFET